MTFSSVVRLPQLPGGSAARWIWHLRPEPVPGRGCRGFTGPVPSASLDAARLRGEPLGSHDTGRRRACQVGTVRAFGAGWDQVPGAEPEPVRRSAMASATASVDRWVFARGTVGKTDAS